MPTAYAQAEVVGDSLYVAFIDTAPPPYLQTDAASDYGDSNSIFLTARSIGRGASGGRATGTWTRPWLIRRSGPSPAHFLEVSRREGKLQVYFSDGRPDEANTLKRITLPHAEKPFTEEILYPAQTTGPVAAHAIDDYPGVLITERKEGGFGPLLINYHSGSGMARRVAEAGVPVSPPTHYLDRGHPRISFVHIFLESTSQTEHAGGQAAPPLRVPHIVTHALL